jgi:hypothetical protein
MPEIKTLDANDFESVFNEKLTEYVKSKIREYNFQYTNISFEEYNNILKRVINTLLDPNLSKSGEHRREAWERGWDENYEKFTDKENIESIQPLYFEKYNVIRWKQNYIKTLSKGFERNSLAIIQDWLFDKYLRGAESVYEFGCGTGHNLLRVREVNSTAEIWGLDWAKSSQKLIQKMGRKGIVKNIYAHNFDYFHPDQHFILKSDAFVYTVASLEQVGSKYEEFISYLLKNKPKLCFHIEPIAELLDENSLLDYLSIEYFRKRNYLSGFLNYLRKLEKSSTIKIHTAQRTYIGSMFIDGYSVIVWQPL